MNKGSLYGLVICGGRSTRMGQDKGLLNYHGMPQRYYVYKMLEPLCDKVFISCSAEHSENINSSYHFITDLPEYENTGPMAGLLSAFDRFPHRDFLVTGCDYPLLNNDELFNFRQFILREKKTAAFYNNKENVYEPLLAFYPASGAEILKKMFHEQKHSLQYFLRQQDAVKYFPDNDQAITSVDTPAQTQLIRQFIQSNRT